jgi:hypothetical protein
MDLSLRKEVREEYAMSQTSNPHDPVGFVIIKPFATVVRTTFDDNDLSTVKSRLLSSPSPRTSGRCRHWICWRTAVATRGPEGIS